MGAPQAKKEIPGNACGSLHDLYLDPGSCPGSRSGTPKWCLSATTPPDPTAVGVGAAANDHRIGRNMPMSWQDSIPEKIKTCDMFQPFSQPA